jgi:hypothetical protein
MRRGSIATIMVATVASVGLAGVGRAGASATWSPHSCGTITWHQAGFTFHDRIYVRRGRVSCATARKVLYHAYASPPPPGGWHCHYHEQNSHGYVNCNRSGDEIYGLKT